MTQAPPSPTAPARRRWMQGALALAGAAALPGRPLSARADPLAPPNGRALREMQVHRVPELGLEIWVENQPAWQAQLLATGSHPVFVAQSPDRYHPPAVMTYSAWAQQRAASGEAVQVLASVAIRRASLNFGLDAARARAIDPTPATHGVLQGGQTQFVGMVDGLATEVRIFVGQAPGRFPVALSVYTLRGKMGLLGEPIRRAWGQLRYLAA